MYKDRQLRDNVRLFREAQPSFSRRLADGFKKQNTLACALAVRRLLPFAVRLFREAQPSLSRWLADVFKKTKTHMPALSPWGAFAFCRKAFFVRRSRAFLGGLPTFLKKQNTIIVALAVRRLLPFAARLLLWRLCRHFLDAGEKAARQWAQRIFCFLFLFLFSFLFLLLFLFLFFILFFTSIFLSFFSPYNPPPFSFVFQCKTSAAKGGIFRLG